MSSEKPPQLISDCNTPFWSYLWVFDQTLASVRKSRTNFPVGNLPVRFSMESRNRFIAVSLAAPGDPHASVGTIHSQARRREGQPNRLEHLARAGDLQDSVRALGH